jgi:hypothetical protein
MANTDRGKTRCPLASGPVRSGADGEELQQCIEGKLVTYDAKTFKEIRREDHDSCDENGMVPG